MLFSDLIRKNMLLKSLIVTVLCIHVSNQQICLQPDLQGILNLLYGWSPATLASIISALSSGVYEYALTINDTDSYDFIIVGAGSAGNVIANRLTENPNWNVLLIEAGDKPCPLMDVAIIPAIWQFTYYNWGYLSEQQAGIGSSFVDGKMAMPRGRGLGGSSLINFMMDVRGNKIDYDRWAYEMENPGWSYNDVLPLFIKSEDCIVQAQDPNFHGRGGPLSVQDVSYRTKVSARFITANDQLGSQQLDYNGVTQLGHSYIQATTRRGLRCSTEKAFLRPAMFRPNLKIMTNSHVTKLLIDANNKVYGVEYFRNGILHRVNANKEVIVSAGAFNSPKLLMLSGIGPQDHLNEMNIPVIKNLPVGKKMYDHLAFLGMQFTITKPESLQISDWASVISLLQLLALGKGPLTMLSAAEAYAFIKTNVSSNPNPNLPDVELIFIGAGFQEDLGLLFRRSFRINDETYNKIWKPLTNNYTWTCWPMLFHPKSFGEIKLRSSNPFDPPKIYGNYFTDANGDDLKTILASVRQVQRISQTQIFQDAGSKLVTVPLPACEQHMFDTDDYWICAIRSISHTLYHPTTTCKMGPATDPEAVVDNRLKVYGIQNLRVADSSVIPLSLSGHINVPTIMIGEKMSNIIKEDYGIP